MKFLRLMLSVVLVSFATAAFAQSNAQKSFDTLKALAGTWEGPVTTIPKMAGMGDNTHDRKSRCASHREETRWCMR